MIIDKNKKVLLKAEKALVLGQFNQAKKLLLEALKSDNKNPEGYYLLGEVYCKQGKFEDSVSYLEKANSLLHEHPRIMHLLGWATFMNGDTASGRRLLLKALSMLPQDITILCDLAVLENQAINTEEAEKYALQAIELDPSHPQAQEVFQATQGFKKLRLFASQKKIRFN